MKVKVKKLDPNAQLPQKAHESDFGYDVVAVSRKKVAWRTWEYKLGLAFEIVREDIDLGFNLQTFKWPKGIDNDLRTESIIAYGAKDFKIPKDIYNGLRLSIDFRPRSSVYKTGLILCNCEGTIDELYRGEVKAYFYSVNPFGKKYKVGDRIGQIKLGITLPFEFEEVKELNMNTERGEGGFGSTGKTKFFIINDNKKEA